MYVDVSANTGKTEEEKELMRKYVAFQCEQHHRQTPGEMVTVVFDMHKATTLTFVRFGDLFYGMMHIPYIMLTIIHIGYKLYDMYLHIFLYSGFHPYTRLRLLLIEWSLV